MQKKRAAAMTVALVLACGLAGCGDNSMNGSDAGPDTDAANGSDGGVDRDAGNRPPPPPPPPPAEGCGQDVVAISHAFTSLGSVTTGREHHGAIQRGANRLVSFGEHLSPAIARIPFIDLTEEGGVVGSAVVAGDPPAGQIHQTVWHPGLDRFVILTYERAGASLTFAMHTMALDGLTATFTRLTQDAVPSANGPGVSGMYVLGSDSLAIQRAEEIHTVQITGEAATWGAAAPLTNPWLPLTQVADPRGGRLLGFGARDFDPGTGAETIRPVIYERSLPTGTWNELPAGGGEPPPDVTSEFGITDAWVAYDAAADRMLIVIEREVYDPGIMETYLQPGLYAYDLAGGQWSTLNSEFYESGFSYGGAWAVDDVNHRALELARPGVRALSTDGPTLGTVEELAMEGRGGPRDTQAATSLNDGRLLALHAGTLSVFDPSAPTPRWEAFGELELPRDTRSGASLDVDPATGDVWLFGGSNTNSSPSMGRVLRIAADGSGFVEETTSNPAPGRSYHTSIVHDGELFVVAGYQRLGALDDVWALDLSTLVWRRVATLPTPRVGVALRVVDSEIWLAGGREGDQGLRDVLALDPSSGAIRELTVSGAWPTRDGIFFGAVPFNGGIVFFDMIDDTLDHEPVQLYFLGPDSGGARFTDLGSCFVDWHLNRVFGVPIAEDHAYIVGSDIFDLRTP